jgi:hypothetical protein
VTRLDWIDIHWPGRSKMLSAPLAGDAGGAQQCEPAVYRTRSDADYQVARALIERAVAEAWTRPRRDLRTWP